MTLRGRDSTISGQKLTKNAEHYTKKGKKARTKERKKQRKKEYKHKYALVFIRRLRICFVKVMKLKEYLSNRQNFETTTAKRSESKYNDTNDDNDNGDVIMTLVMLKIVVEATITIKLIY